MIDYIQFLTTKALKPKMKPVPFSGQFNGALFPHQRDCVEMVLNVGTGALFCETGTGKTIMQLEWARHIPGDVIVAAPLAVANQTIREGKRHLNMEIGYSKDGTVNERVTITNYERLHLFDLSRFTGVILDESSILKSFSGKVKQFLCDSFSETPYKLACTATPAPNDYMELGNHSEFLGIMPGTEMLSRWFINDPSKVGSYRLKGHAVKPFWSWVASWAACMSKPSDLGYSDDGYDLPPLRTHTHQVETQTRTAFDDGLLFDMPEMNATNLHRKKRESVDDRVRLVADMVNDDTDPWLVWCESNQESEMLTKAIPDAVDVKGAHDADTKEERLIGFVDGKYRVLVTKSSIAGFGLNLQHCRKQVFASISYSYEKFYQAVRRSWRFGQTQPVDIHVVVADAEIPVWRAIEKKALAHDQMKEHMKYAVFSKGQESQVKIDYNPTYQAKLPEWL